MNKDAPEISEISDETLVRLFREQAEELATAILRYTPPAEVTLGELGMIELAYLLSHLVIRLKRAARPQP